MPEFLGFEILGIFPHMHVLGTGYEMQVESDDGLDCITRSDRYDFDNQQMYMFDDPPVVSGGSTLRFECTYNNSPSNPDLIHNPPIEVGYGERTDEEMCFFFTMVSY